MKKYILINNETREVCFVMSAENVKDLKNKVDNWAAQPWANADGKPPKIDWSAHSIALLLK